MTYRRYVLDFPADLVNEEVTRFMRSLSVLPTGDWIHRRAPVVLEMSASHHHVAWYLTLHESHIEPVVGLMRMHLPSIRVHESDKSRLELPTQPMLAFEIRLSNQDRHLDSEVGGEVAAGLLSVVSALRRDETVNLQWLIGPSLPRRVSKQALDRHRAGFVERIFVAPTLDAEQARARNLKQQEPLFGSLGRIAIVGATQGRRTGLARSLMGVLRLTSKPSVHLMTRRLPTWMVRSRMQSLHVPRVAWPAHLNAAELTAVIAWPIGGPVSAGFVYSGRRELPFATSTLSNEHESRSPGKGERILGRASFPGREGLVMLAEHDARQHLHVVGPTGVGKSTLLTSLAVQDIEAGRGVVVIEPKGDLVFDIAARIPESRREDVVVLDPSSDNHSVGIDVLHPQAGSAEVTVDALVHQFRAQFSSSWGPRTQDVLHSSLLTLACQRGLTLVEIPLLLTDSGFRAKIIGDVRSDHVLGPFWAWFEALSENERSQVVAPVLNKVRAFTIRSTVRRMLGQSNPAFSLRDVFTKRRILLVPLKPGKIGPEAANLLGGLVVAQLWQVLQERSELNPRMRHTVMLYLDEFQTYLDLPTDLGEMLAQARGLGLGITLAHQHLKQLTNPELKSAVMSNARSKIVFQSGSTDAKTLADALGGGLAGADIMSLGRYEAYARLMVNESSTSPGSLVTLPPSPAVVNAKQVIRDSQRRYGAPVDDVDEQIAHRRATPETGTTGGRRRRAT